MLETKNQEQRKLGRPALEAFAHREFVLDQTAAFLQLFSGRLMPGDIIVDLGGGVGHFAFHLTDLVENVSVHVIDTDISAVKRIDIAQSKSVAAFHESAVEYVPSESQRIGCFNLVLHHLVGSGFRETRLLQEQAIANWCDRGKLVFVNEYIYESPFDLGGAAIYGITSSSILSWLAGQISRFAPRLHANTFGVGVRFRSSSGWEAMFERSGFRVVGKIRGQSESVYWPLRAFGITAISRDSYLLEAVGNDRSIKKSLL